MKQRKMGWESYVPFGFAVHSQQSVCGKMCGHLSLRSWSLSPRPLGSSHTGQPCTQLPPFSMEGKNCQTNRRRALILARGALLMSHHLNRFQMKRSKSDKDCVQAQAAAHHMPAYVGFPGAGSKTQVQCVVWVSAMAQLTTQLPVLWCMLAAR